MFIKNVLRLICTGAVALGLTYSTLHAQIVSSGLTGLVRDTGGNPMSGANVTVVHQPTNATSTAVTNQFGRFTVRGLPVGGPFVVTATSGGNSASTDPNIFTELGADTEVTITLKSDVVTLEKFVATASRNDLDASVTGSYSVLDNARIEAQPTINRSFADLIRTNPYATIRAGNDRITVLGMNNRFNTISVDGARINDTFGLSASGLASTNNPFALEAIESFNVDVSPYDVRRSGFVGASINAVTKSGTNEFHGSAYGVFTNDDMQGADIIGANAGNRIFSEEKTYGFTLGGPIIKDRLFFFANYDNFERQGTSVSPVFTPDATALSTIQTRLTALASSAGVSEGFGSVSGGANTTTEEKRLLKLDWNITQDHRMTVRFSDTEGGVPAFGGLNSTSFSGGAFLSGQPTIGRITALTSNFYNAARLEEVWAGQIFSNWTPDFKTTIAYSKVDQLSDSVTPVIFPEVRVYNVPGTDANTGAAIANGVIVFGSENSRHGNKIEVNTESYSASGDYTWRNFTLSGGFDHEESDYFNVFRQSSYGVFGYNSITNFVNDVPFASTRAVVQSGLPFADISRFEQTGIFGQIKTELSNRLSFTLGLRYDWMASPIKPPTNPSFYAAFGIDNRGTVDDTDLLAPRASFNYAFDDERTTQLRGGVGIILGRNPWVWLSNSFGNTGVGRFTDARTTSSNPPVQTLANYLSTSFDPANPIGESTATPPTAVQSIAFVDDHLNLPSMWRGNLAIDHKLARLGANLTIEYVQTDMIDTLFIENINLRPTTVGADGRQRFAGSASAAPRVVGFSNVLRMRNIDAGGSRYWSIQLDRPMRNGWAYAASYTRGSSKEAQNLGSSTAGSTWQFNAVFNQGAVEVERSDFEIRDRILASVTKEFKYWRDLKTTVSLFYEGRTGSPYSWVYSTDLNGDGFTGNDLVAVPTGVDDPRFNFSALPAAQAAGYVEFFRQNGMGKYAGSYAPKNSFVQPFQNRLDLRIQQEIPVSFRDVRVKLFLDFINFGSWLSEDIFNYVETLPIPTNTGLVRQITGGSYNAQGQIVVPANTFGSNGLINVPSNSAIAINNGDSRWRIQVGARLEF